MDQSLATLKLGNGAHLGAGQLQYVFDVLSLILLQIQDDLVLGVVDDGPSVFAVIQTEEIAEILRRCYGGTAITTDDLEDLQTKLGGQFIGRRTNELPDLVIMAFFLTRSALILPQT